MKTRRSDGLAVLLGSLAFTLLLLSIQPALSAGPGPDGNRGHLNRLLHNQSVIEHLGLSADQAAAAKLVSGEIVESHRKAFETAMAPATRAERVPLVAKVFVSVNEDTFHRLSDVLSPHQLARLKQIETRSFGLRAFGRPAMIEQLELSLDQQTAIRSLADSNGDRLASVSRSQELDETQRREQARLIRDSALQEALAHLEAEQVVKWELLTGTPFYP